MEPDIDKIEAYLSGNMTGAERQAFEAEIGKDQSLAEEVDAVRLAREAVELSISDSLRARFQEWGQTASTETKTEEAKVVTMTPRRSLGRILSIAASVLLILAVGSFWYANNQFSTDTMAAAYYDNVSLDLSVRGDADPMANAVDALENGNYTEADAYFSSIAEGDDLYFDAQYYLAHSLYRQGAYAASIEQLDNLAAVTNPNLRENGAWLKVLNYLALGQTENDDFQTLLNSMVEDDGHAHHNDAVALDKKLNSFWYQLAN